MQPTGTPPPTRSGPPWLLPLLGGLAAIVLIVGVIVWATTGGGDEITSATSTVAPTGSDAATTTTAPTTTVAPSTTTTSTTTSTSTTTTTTTTTTPPPSGTTWTVESDHFPEPLVLTRAAEGDGIVAYDGQQAVGDGATRCIAVVADGVDGWQEWCGPANGAVRFVAMAGIDPWVVEAGADPGDIRLTVQEPIWGLQPNGCTAPIGTLIGTAGLRAQVAVGVVCVGDTAIVEFGGVLLQPGGVDGGLALMESGDEGWNLIDGGTSLPCVGADGADRCADFATTGSLDETPLPLPPLNVLPTSANVVGVGDVTTTVRGWVGDATGPQEVADLVEAQLVDPDAEAPASVQRANQLDFGRTNLLVIEVPQLDDSVQTVTTAVWIDRTGDRAPVLRAVTWSVCARGVAGGLCV